MKRFMMGYHGELIFWMDENDRLVDLEVLAHWSPYTPKMELGKVYCMIG